MLGIALKKLYRITLKRTKVKREVQLAPQRENTLGLDYATKMTEEASPPLPDISNPATTANIVRFTNQRKAQEGFGTVSKDNTVRPTLQIASNYFGTNFKELLTALIALVAILILVLISIGVFIACACWKNQSGHVQTSRCTVTCCAKNVYNEGYQPVLGNTTPQTGKTVK